MSLTNVRGSQIADNTVVLTSGVGQDVTGILPVPNGGTGANTLPLNNILIGNGTGAILAIAPTTNGNVLTVVGGVWAAAAPSSSGGRAFAFFTT